MTQTDVALFDLEPEVEAWRPFYARFGLSLADLVGKPICRDCGRSKYEWAHACGGADVNGIFYLCDDCATLDGVGARYDGAGNCSRWGITSTEEKRAALTAAREKQRAKFRAENAELLSHSNNREDRSFWN